MEIVLGVLFVAVVVLMIARAIAHHSTTRQILPAPQVEPAQQDPSARRIDTPSTAVLVHEQRAPSAVDETHDLDSGREDEWAAVVSQPVRSNTDVDLVYRDGKDQRTLRRVTVLEFDYAAPRYLLAFCHLRQARRTFYMGRVEQSVDPETGEVLDSLHEFLRAKYESSPELSLDRLYSAQRNAMRVLLYVGKADGRLTAAERRIMHRVARELTDDDRLTEHQIDKVLNEFTAPSRGVFQTAIRTLVKEESLERRLAVLRGAEDMVATQATVHPDEQLSLDYMRTRLTQPEPADVRAPREPVAGFGTTLEARKREAAEQLQQQKDASSAYEIEATEDAMLPPRCSVCFADSGARLPLPAGAWIGTYATCEACGFEQVIMPWGARRAARLMIYHEFDGSPMPPAERVPLTDEVRAQYSLTARWNGPPVGRFRVREAQAAAALESAQAKCDAGEITAAECARVTEQIQRELDGDMEHLRAEKRSALTAQRRIEREAIAALKKRRKDTDVTKTAT